MVEYAAIRDTEKKVLVFRTGVYGTWREKFSGITAYARSAGWTLQVVNAWNIKPDFHQLIKYWNPTGIILDASCAPEMFNGERFDNLPVVAMNPEGRIRGRSMPSVASDSRQIAKIAVSELLNGNPASILFVEWFEPKMSWSAEKRAVCEEIARMHNLPFRAATPCAEDAANPTILERSITDALNTMPRPCGVFAVTDAIGSATVSAANRIGAKIPEEIAVVSVDDDPEICESCSPTLSSVRPDFHRLGFCAGKMLAEAMEGNGEQERVAVVTPLGIVRRASTCHIRVYDRMVLAALEKIRLRACEGITPGIIAKDFPVTRRMAEIRFKAATGRTIGEELLERRFAVACDYIMEGRSSVSAIANFCGWNSDVAFRKAFRSRFGTSPLQWFKKQCAK